ncbi:MAG: hypothetical protein JWM08_1603 [Candidatus Angelobacter sp.]|nr:hypothetical protein [Candidatus Angelobacter sp.]
MKGNDDHDESTIDKLESQSQTCTDHRVGNRSYPLARTIGHHVSTRRYLCRLTGDYLGAGPSEGIHVHSESQSICRFTNPALSFIESRRR